MTDSRQKKMKRQRQPRMSLQFPSDQRKETPLHGKHQRGSKKEGNPHGKNRFSSAKKKGSYYEIARKVLRKKKRESKFTLGRKPRSKSYLGEIASRRRKGQYSPRPQKTEDLSHPKKEKTIRGKGEDPEHETLKNFRERGGGDPPKEKTKSHFKPIQKKGR